MIVLGLLACGWFDSVPPQVQGAVRVSVSEDSIEVGGEPVMSVAALRADPVHPVADPIAAKLKPGALLWFDLPGGMPWFEVRRVVGSAAEGSEIWLQIPEDPAVLQTGPAPVYRPGFRCDPKPLKAIGATPLVTLSVQTGPDGAWLLGAARFLIQTPEELVDLDPKCFAKTTCEDLYAGSDALAEACRQGAALEESPQNVQLGGPNGCMLPLAKSSEQVSVWRKELPGVLEGLGLLEHPNLIVMPEGRVRWDAVMAVLASFEDRKLTPPAIGTPLVEGNDGAPVCSAPVRSRKALDQAGARWVGATLVGREVDD